MTRSVVAVTLGVVAVALVVAGLVVIVTGHELPPNGVGALLALIVGALCAIAGVAIAAPLRKEPPP